MLTEIKDRNDCDVIEDELDYVTDRLIMSVRKSSIDFQVISQKLQWNNLGVGLIVWAISDEFGFGIHEEFYDVL